MIGTGATISARTITIISSQSLVSLGLQSVLESHKTGVVVQSHRRVTKDLFLPENCPTVFAIDLEANGDVVAQIREIRESAPTSRILVLSGVDDWHGLKEACAYGVDGVILTIQPPEVALAVIERVFSVASGSTQGYASGSVSVAPRDKPAQALDSAACLPVGRPTLTLRERAVVQLVQQGLSNKEIADRLSLSDHTVRHHLTSIFDKLGVSNRKKLLVQPHQFSSTLA